MVWFILYLYGIAITIGDVNIREHYGIFVQDKEPTRIRCYTTTGKHAITSLSKDTLLGNVRRSRCPNAEINARDIEQIVRSVTILPHASNGEISSSRLSTVSDFEA
jgi:hypothetical protein